jgi:Protein of unknown function (Porph_ging).
VLLFIAINKKSFTQDFEVVDNAKWLITYNYEFLQDSTSKYSLKQLQMVLQIGLKASKYCDLRSFLSDSILYLKKNQELNDDNINSVMEQVSKLTDGINTNLLASNSVYKNFPNKGTTFFRAYADSKYFKVIQPLAMTWKLEPSKDTIIASYHCKKATTTFAGRNYNAWYTTQIPISEGPYKFNGLPGLIIKINDIENEHRFILTSFKMLKYYQPITLSKIDYIEITPKEYVMVLRNFINKLSGRLQTNDIKIFSEEGKARSLQGLKARNNFIEKY